MFQVEKVSWSEFVRARNGVAPSAEVQRVSQASEEEASDQEITDQAKPDREQRAENDGNRQMRLDESVQPEKPKSAPPKPAIRRSGSQPQPRERWWMKTTLLR